MPKATEKIALITDGTSGIGKQTAVALARLGAHVIVTGRSRASGEAAVNEIKQLSGSQQIDALMADLSTQRKMRRPLSALTSNPIRSNASVRRVVRRA
ncbi:MAG: SDR family NAD(P)-dependent oxidoreductase [Chloroflexota bacterium]